MSKVKFIVGISGGSGSGKTTFARNLSANFSPNEVTWLSQDHYYKHISKQYIDENGVENYDRLDSIDSEKYLSDIKELQNGNSLILKEYVFNNDQKKAEDIVIDPAPILIVEGLFVFSLKNLFREMNLTLYVDAQDHSMLIRRMKRDAKERNYPPEDVMYRWEHHVWPAYEELILPFRRKVDLIVNNENKMDTALDVITTYLKAKLKEL